MLRRVGVEREERAWGWRGRRLWVERKEGRWRKGGEHGRRREWKQRRKKKVERKGEKGFVGREEERKEEYG